MLPFEALLFWVLGPLASGTTPLVRPVLLFVFLIWGYLPLERPALGASATASLRGTTAECAVKWLKIHAHPRTEGGDHPRLPKGKPSRVTLQASFEGFPLEKGSSRGS